MGLFERRRDCVEVRGVRRAIPKGDREADIGLVSPVRGHGAEVRGQQLMAPRRKTRPPRNLRRLEVPGRPAHAVEAHAVAELLLQRVESLAVVPT